MREEGNEREGEPGEMLMRRHLELILADRSVARTPRPRRSATAGSSSATTAIGSAPPLVGWGGGESSAAGSPPLRLPPHLAPPMLLSARPRGSARSGETRSSTRRG
jgi:hypothetical protein